MKPAPRRARVPAIAAALGIAFAATAPDEAHSQANGSGPHLFTGKNGQQVSAVLLDVSEDRRLMTIRRDDGQQFQTEILSLSLEDQAYIREWLRDRPVAANYAVEIAIQRKQSSTRRRSVSSATTIESRVFEYEIVVTNRSRDPLREARLEYAVVLDDRVNPRLGRDGEPSFSISRGEGANFVRLSSASEVEPLPFNRSATIQTIPVPVHTVRYTTSGIYREDELLGVRARLLAADGAVIAEQSNGTSALERLDWEAIAALEAVEEDEEGMD